MLLLTQHAGLPLLHLTHLTHSNSLQEHLTHLTHTASRSPPRAAPQEFVDHYLLMVRACADRDKDVVVAQSVHLGFLTGGREGEREAGQRLGAGGASDSPRHLGRGGPLPGQRLRVMRDGRAGGGADGKSGRVGADACAPE